MARDEKLKFGLKPTVFDGSGTSQIMKAIKTEVLIKEMRVIGGANGGGSLISSGKADLEKETPMTGIKKPLEESAMWNMVNKQYFEAERDATGKLVLDADGKPKGEFKELFSDRERALKMNEYEMEVLKYREQIGREQTSYEAKLKGIASYMYGLMISSLRGEALKSVKHVQELDEYERVKAMVAVLRANYGTLSDQEYSQVLAQFAKPMPKKMSIEQYSNYVDNLKEVIETKGLTKKTDHDMFLQLVAAVPPVFTPEVDELFKTLRTRPFVERGDPEYNSDLRMNLTEIRNFLAKRQRTLVERGVLSKLNMTDKEVEDYFHGFNGKGKENDKNSGRERKKTCHTCGMEGHISKDCNAPSCYTCGGYDHLAFACNMNDGKCFNCGKSGHFAKDCSEAKKETPIGDEEETNNVGEARNNNSRGRGNYRGNGRGRGRGAGRGRGNSRGRVRGRGRGNYFANGGGIATYFLGSTFVGTAFQAGMQNKGKVLEGILLDDPGSRINVVIEKNATDMIVCNGALKGVGSTKISGVSCVLGLIQNRDGSIRELRMESAIVADVPLNIFGSSDHQARDDTDFFRKGKNRRMEVRDKFNNVLVFDLDTFGEGNLLGMKFKPKPEPDWTEDDRKFIQKCRSKNTRLAEAISNSYVSVRRDAFLNNYRALAELEEEEEEVEEEEVEEKEGRIENKINKKKKSEKKKISEKKVNWDMELEKEVQQCIKENKKENTKTNNIKNKLFGIDGEENKNRDGEVESERKEKKTLLKKRVVEVGENDEEIGENEVEEVESH
jgi:hypothetical protein